MEEPLNIKEIMKLVPHRYPFLLVDKILELIPGERITGLKNVTINEPFFQGHFQGEPIMPGVLIIEAMAQTGCILGISTLPEDSKDKLVLFAGIDKVRFRQPVVPGDQLIIKLELLRQKRKIIKMKAVATVNEKVVAEAELLASIGGLERDS